MGFLKKFENQMEDSLEGAAERFSNAPISPVKIAKQAEKAMRRERMVGAGKQYAPTLYTVLVNPDDDRHLFGYYPTLAGETETYLAAKANEEGLIMDGQPLVRFIVDGALKHGKFDVIAEAVAAPIVDQLRNEEMQRYGIAPAQPPVQAQAQAYGRPAPAPAPAAAQYDPRDQHNGYGQQSYSQAPQAYAPEANGGFDPYAPASDYSGWGMPEAQHIPGADPQRGPAPAPSPMPPAQPMQAATPAAAVAGAAIAPATIAFANGADPQANAQAQGVLATLYDAATGQAFPVFTTRAVIGRGSTCDCMLSDINASRNHAELRWEPQGFWSLSDLGSTNGTLVNNQPIASVALQEGDTITIGITNLVFTPY